MHKIIFILVIERLHIQLYEIGIIIYKHLDISGIFSIFYKKKTTKLSLLCLKFFYFMYCGMTKAHSPNFEFTMRSTLVARAEQDLLTILNTWYQRKYTEVYNAQSAGFYVKKTVVTCFSFFLSFSLFVVHFKILIIVLVVSIC